MKAWHRPLVALGMLAPACSPAAQPVHRATTGTTTPLRPLEPADEAIQPEPATTTTTEPPAPVTTVTVSKLPPTTRGTTTTVYVLPEAAGEEDDETWWAKQPGYVPGACGGTLPPCYVMRRESGGDPSAVNATGCGGRGCFGKWQFDPRTSQGLGYSRPMNQYDEATQDEAARRLWAGGRGCSHWNAC